MPNRLTISAVGLLSLMLSSRMQAQPPRSLLVEAPKGRFVGLPIHWGARDAALLESSGRIHVFDSPEILNHQLLEEVFQPQTLQQANLQLQAELGSQFETLVTGPYVIGAPTGESRRWESRFRALLAGYMRYCEVRGWSLRKPDFPLVVIVMPSRTEFELFSSRELGGKEIPGNLAGMYIPRSNRCIVYHIGYSESTTNWAATEETITHEAIHQLAYNTGLHERLFQNPLWLVEGLATMFEVPALYDTSLQRSSITDRIHRDKAAELQELLKEPKLLPDLLHSMVDSDQLYRQQPNLAYALGWAMVFYLAERMPTEFYDYIGRQRTRGFQEYTAGDRQWDFRTAFQMSPEQLAPQIQRLLLID